MFGGLLYIGLFIRQRLEDRESEIFKKGDNMKSKILHLSDLHVGGANHEKRHLKRIVDKIMGEFSDEALTVLITGDIVNDGQKKQYETVSKLLSRLIENPNFNVWPVPGNHDYGWNGIHAERQRFRYFKSAFYDLENVTYPHVKVHDAGHVFIGLNSMKAECDFWDGLLADGELGSRQIHNVSGILNDFDEMPQKRRKQIKVIVHLHHHPFLFPDDSWIEEGIEKMGHWLKDGPGLMGVLAGRIDILLFGHEHRHLDFSNTGLSRKFRIPHILSCGKSTEKLTEYATDAQGHATKEALNQGFMGRMIEIDSRGKVQTETVIF